MSPFEVGFVSVPINPLRFIHAVCANGSFHLLLRGSPCHDACAGVKLFTPWVHPGSCQVLAGLTKLLWTFTYQFLCGPKFSFFWNKSPGVQVLACVLVSRVKSNCQMASHCRGGLTHYQQRMNDPASLHPGRHLLTLLLFLMFISIGVQGYHCVLICIPWWLMTWSIFACACLPSVHPLP